MAAELELTAESNATPELLLDASGDGSVIEVGVHDASRLAWNVCVPIAEGEETRYAFELEIQIPANLLPVHDPWAQLQSYARLDTPQPAGVSDGSAEAFRRSVVAYTFKLARARDGFVRHCAVIRSGASSGAEGRALLLWLEAARRTLEQARHGLAAAPPGPAEDERALADEYLSAQIWTVLTDCARALLDTRRVAEEHADTPGDPLDDVESALVGALQGEIAHRRQAGFPNAQPTNARQLERFLSRSRWLKRHFQRVLFLDSQTFQIAQRLGAWFGAAAAVAAYLWFFFWQVFLERRTGSSDVSALGPGLVAFALLTSVAYASRERLKDATRGWLAGRVQRLFAQRVVRHRMPATGKRPGALVVRARESFSQSTTAQPDPLDSRSGSTVQATVLRFTHRGVVLPRPRDAASAAQVRHVFRYDLSALFPRLHDAFKGLAVPDPESHRVIITDVPRNYELPLRAALRSPERSCVRTGTLVLNKNGLLRFEADAPQAA